MKNGETKTVELDSEQATLQIKHFGNRSNKLTVKSGDSVEMDIKKWVYWQWVFTFIAVFISSMLTPQVETLPFFESWNIFLVAALVGVTVGLFAGIPYLLFDSYELYKVTGL